MNSLRSQRNETIKGKVKSEEGKKKKKNFLVGVACF